MNNNLDKKLILFDIDGTLYDNANKCFPKSTISALEELHKTAIIGIATGRAGFMLYSIQEILHLVDYFVLINGQYIEAKEKVIYESPIDTEHLSALVKDIDKYGVSYGFQGSKDEAVSHLDSLTRESFESLGLHIPPVNKDYFLNNKVYQAWVFCDSQIASELSKLHPQFHFIKWMKVGYDILPVNASKGAGMKRLAEHLMMDINNVVAFGDGDNDYEMIRDAGLGIGMGNATSKVKSVADYITTSVDQDGISKALKHFGFIK